MWSSSFMSRYSPEEGKSTILKRYMHFSVHCSISYNTQDLEVTLILRDGWRDKKEVVYMHNGVLAIKRVILPFVTRWMGVDNSMLSEKSSVQFSHSVVSYSLWPHGLQHTRPPCPSPTPGVYSNSCPLTRWCHPTISSSVIPFSSCLQSFPASGSIQMGQLFASDCQSIGVSASTSVLPINIQD